MIISFGWTSDALLAGAKDCTRRDWSPNFVKRNARYMVKGAVWDAWDALPRVVSKLPAHIATIELTADVEASRSLPLDDYAHEGFGWLKAYGYTLAGDTVDQLWGTWTDQLQAAKDFAEFDLDRPLLPLPYVVRFRILEFTEAGTRRRRELRALGRRVRTDIG